MLPCARHKLHVRSSHKRFTADMALASTQIMQILEAIRLLQESNTIPIQRARMRIRLTLPSKDGKRLQEEILKTVDKVEENEWSEDWELVRFSPVCAMKSDFRNKANSLA
jgi:ribosome maturation protein Sdo1